MKINNPAISKQQHYIILTATVLIFILLQLPVFSIVQYPFRLLGTWFHEMGHGVTALLLGGDFSHLEIYRNGGGTAYTSVSSAFLPYNISRALVAAGGLFGTTIVGTLFIISAKTKRTASIALRILIAFIILSLLLWIRSFWGIITLSVFALTLGIISFTKNKTLELSTLLFLGLQAIFSSYLQLDYLFTKQFIRGNQVLNSDTQNIAENSFGTYWFWALLIILISIYIVYKGVRFYFRK
ncbi:M50 family metallopeptidase [uncultured Tenacibaculum sp.]|uniref:M50 family metallopeptidase n=1 Tax=uncultured Tenacibaculum sp. TaxID=174713 RepID=UPI002624D673|nr:M50 family metallopeptidase [uncultured Tenacibaculum sp.]